MRDLILERERGGTGMRSSAVGGWSSHKDLLSWNAPCIKELEQMFRRVAVEATRATTRKHKRGDYPFEMEAWANILRPSGYHVPHSHDGCESRMAVMSAAWFVEFRQRLPWLLHVD